MSKILVDRKLLEHLAAFALDAKSFAMNRGGSGWKLQAQKALIAMDAVRIAMAQPVAKPYAWAVTGTGLFSIGPERPFDDDVWQPVYTSPPPPAQPVVQHLPADDTEGGAL